MPFFVHFIFLPFRAFFVVTTCILRLFGAFLVVVVCTFHINAYIKKRKEEKREINFKIFRW